jgi:molybdate transport system substrate-binding protein
MSRRDAARATLAAMVRALLAASLLCATLAACGRDAGPAAVAGAPSPPLLVFAAASLAGAMDAAAAAFEDRSGQAVRVSYAGSSALARQIDQRAPADVFVSADREWMDWLQARALVDPATRVDLLGNTLVLVAPGGSGAQALELTRRVDLQPLLGEDGRLALALTDSVPAGKYARAGFESLGLWKTLQPRVTETENVRAALLLVARGEAPLGVVYASDARAEPRVKVLATFPAGSHPDIAYPVARIRASAHPQAQAFIDWLQSPEAGAIFRRHGFVLR